MENKPSWTSRHLNWTIALSVILFYITMGIGGSLDGTLLPYLIIYLFLGVLSLKIIAVSIITNIIMFTFWSFVCWALRKKDRNGWYSALILVPIIGLVVLLMLHNKRTLRINSTQN
jgi:hypothetical protein